MTPDERRAYDRAYRLANREKIRAGIPLVRRCLDCAATLVGRSPRCPEHRAARSRARSRAGFARWYAANPQKAHLRARNHEKELATKRAHYEANREKINAQNRAWRKAHPEKVRVWNRAFRVDRVSLLGERLSLARHPELRELAMLLKQARKAIRQMHEGGTQ